MNTQTRKLCRFFLFQTDMFKPFGSGYGHWVYTLQCLSGNPAIWYGQKDHMKKRWSTDNEYLGQKVVWGPDLPPSVKWLYVTTQTTV